MSPEVLIIIFLSSLLLILLIIQFFFSNNGSRERIKILLEKQENLEKSIYQIFNEKFEKIDNKFQKSSAENSSNLFEIKEKISQKCKVIFLSPIFNVKKSKKFLD